ncbi:hypothetical protein [Lentzea sp. E54]|uniref:hypothetical protein n=1 Tax=Lentzea xerophila TaxID=3435883 RepID=UPI003DA23FC1
MSMAVPGQDLVGVDAHQLEHWADLTAAEGVTAVSATPTFWRRALLRGASGPSWLALQQIPLGGEAVEQRLLDELARRFPRARRPITPVSAIHDQTRSVSRMSAWTAACRPGSPLPSSSGFA